MNVTLARIAWENFLSLIRNSYPGRGIILGRTPNGSYAIVYFLEGRSGGSRNRILAPVEGKDGWLQTRVADPSGFSGDPSLLIYSAMAEGDGCQVVTNGAQTDVIALDGIDELDHWKYEPDNPNFTPRISGIIRYLPDGATETRLVILRKSPFGEGCDRHSYSYGEISPGYGYFVSTYSGNGEPLPSFRGEPWIMPICSDDPAQIAAMYWAALDRDNRVALAVKVILPTLPSEIYIINRHEVVQP